MCDDLSQHNSYKNRNYEWSKLYNATIVVPIQANLSGDKRNKNMVILGFLCCDNITGGFDRKEVKDFLAAIGDLLFNLFHLYDRLFQLMSKKGIHNDRSREYDNWNDS